MTLVMIGGMGTASARPVGGLDAASLLAASDTVIVGRIITTTDVKPVIGATDSTIFEQRAKIRVNSVLKGEEVVGRNSLVVHTHSYNHLRSGIFGIFFLHRAAHGTYANARDESWIAQARQDRPRSNPSSMTAETAITVEMLAILGTSKDRLTDRKAGVNYTYPDMLQTRVDSIYFQACSSLAAAPLETIEPRLRVLLRRPDPVIRLWAADCLMERGLFDPLNDIIPLLLHPTRETQQAADWASWRLRGTSDHDFPRTLSPSLIALLGSQSATIRGNAGDALAPLKDPGALRPLVTAMEAETDIDALHKEARGLCDLTRTTTDACREVDEPGNPVLPVSYWRQWAQSVLRDSK